METITTSYRLTLAAGHCKRSFTCLSTKMHQWPHIIQNTIIQNYGESDWRVFVIISHTVSMLHNNDKCNTNHLDSRHFEFSRTNNSKEKTRYAMMPCDISTYL